ncbi:MAG: hypothetical protein IT167_04070 [Bryobacterales bacterium]|nr:hypothetical protein [Bryobacterales bacterium]
MDRFQYTKALGAKLEPVSVMLSAALPETALAGLSPDSTGAVTVCAWASPETTRVHAAIAANGRRNGF